MNTIVAFRPRRNEADAARRCPAVPSQAHEPASDLAGTSAEIILMPLNWLKQLGCSRPRKPLKRRFALRNLAPA